MDGHRKFLALSGGVAVFIIGVEGMYKLAGAVCFGLNLVDRVFIWE